MKRALLMGGEIGYNEDRNDILRIIKQNPRIVFESMRLRVEVRKQHKTGGEVNGGCRL